MLNADQKYCRMLSLEHSAIHLLLTFIKLPFIIKIFVLSIFEWPPKTGFTVYIDIVRTFHFQSIQGCNYIFASEHSPLTANSEGSHETVGMCWLAIAFSQSRDKPPVSLSNKHCAAIKTTKMKNRCSFLSFWHHIN